VPWLVALARTATPTRAGAGARAFGLGLSMGAVYFAGTLYWIPGVLVTYGGLSWPVALPVAGLLIAYLALFPAAASLVVGRAQHAYGRQALWLAPMAWVATEWLRGWLFTGFPWVSLGYSQSAWLPVAQTASLAGVWGLSALIVAANTALAFTLLPGRAPRFGVALVATLVAGLTAWGAWRLQQPIAGGGTLRVGIVQGNVPQDQKWSPEHADDILRRYLHLSREAAARGARLILWPESATPFFFEEDPAGSQAIRSLARDTGTWILFGSDQYERGDPPRYYNAAFLVGPDGGTAGVYRKQHLVPFGEYVPLKRLLFFVGPVVEAVADFSPGTDTALLPVDGHLVSTAICYEVVFGGLSRAAVQAGAELLTTVTNDAWYGTTSAPWQHFEQARLRAIEQGRYLVRAANTGVSGVVDAHGRVVARGDLFETTLLVHDVQLADGASLYAKMGDSFAWACAIFVPFALVRLEWMSKRSPIERSSRGRVA
jgi:apolipoprotein N-acyltransferase